MEWLDKHHRKITSQDVNKQTDENIIAFCRLKLNRIAHLYIMLMKL